MKKTFKIGESCLHGIIIVEVDETTIIIRVCEWRTNEEKFFRVFNKESFKQSQLNVFLFLTDVTTAYYADNIISFIKKNT